jgi:hypothetical protein
VVAVNAFGQFAVLLGVWALAVLVAIGVVLGIIRLVLGFWP